VGSTYDQRKERSRSTVSPCYKDDGLSLKTVSFSEVAAGARDYSRQQRNVLAVHGSCSEIYWCDIEEKL
jgi:hypothetical protein